MSSTMNAPTPTGNNLLDSVIFTTFFLGLFSFIAQYSRELVGVSAIITIIIGLYRICMIIKNILKHTKDVE